MIKDSAGGIPRELSGAPIPVLRAWAYLLAEGGGYVGTPGELYLEMAGNGCKISRRSLPIALEWLEALGLARVRRRGHYLEVILSGVAA